MSKTDFNAAQAATIARNDIVVRVAKMIDPSAFSPWFNTNTGEEVDAVRNRYTQAKAISLAAQILKLAASTHDLKKQLADSEAADWELLGVSISKHQALRDVIDRKHGLEPRHD